MQTWQVGNFKITKVLEFPIEVGLLDGLIAQLTPDTRHEIDWLHPDYLNEDGQILADMHCFVIDNGEHVILTDAGCGNGKSYPMQPIWSNLDNPFLERLAEAGYPSIPPTSSTDSWTRISSARRVRSCSMARSRLGRRCLSPPRTAACSRACGRRTRASRVGSSSTAARPSWCSRAGWW